MEERSEEPETRPPSETTTASDHEPESMKGKDADQVVVELEKDPWKEEKKEKQQKRKGTLLYSCFTLIMTTVGIGVLLIPQGFAFSGVVPGVIVILICGFMTDICLCMLVRASEGAQKFSYEECAEHYLGVVGGYVVAITVIIDLIFSCLSLTQIGMGSLTVVFSRWAHCKFDTSKSTHVPCDDRIECTTFFSRELLGFAFLLVMSPFLVRKSVHALRHVSMFAAASLMTSFCLLFALHAYLTNSSKPDLQEAYPLPWNDTVEMYTDFGGFCCMFGLAFLCYLCQFQIFIIYKELEDRSNIRTVIHASMLGFVTPVYIIVGLVGYCLMGRKLQELKENIFDNFAEYPLGQVAGLIVATTSVLKLPLLFNPLRTMISELIAVKWTFPDRWYYRLPLTVVICIMIYFVALYATLSNVSLVTGATTGSTLGFIFPGIYFIRWVQLYGKAEGDDVFSFANLSKENKRRYIQGVFFVVFGILGGAASGYGVYKDWVTKQDLTESCLPKNICDPLKDICRLAD